jgi:hypothetical protein
MRLKESNFRTQYGGENHIRIAPLVSPEKRYINQRLNIRIYYSEQLSVQPRERSMEEKARSIRDIVLLKQIEEKQERLRRIELI